MVTEDHGVRQFPTNAHQPHRDTHDQPNRTNMYEKAHAIYRGKTPSFLLLFNPPPHSASLSLPFSLSAHPSGYDVLPAATTAHSLFGPRAADRHARCLCVSVCLSVPPFFNTSLSGVSATAHAASHCPLLSVICLHLLTSDYLCFFFSGLWGRSYHKKKKGNKQTPPPISLALAPSPSPASLLLQSQQLHLPICVSSARDMDGRDLSLFQN
ncbi:hypothetical protein AMECASPLE_023080 [Ameca splendens]|uniref:Uncharacterized protein n=1 Tax=Ameca splendens TaxID=208324 RepID=A0ABV0YQX6_9TELE